jgi:hypothetical protein
MRARRELLAMAFPNGAYQNFRPLIALAWMKEDTVIDNPTGPYAGVVGSPVFEENREAKFLVLENHMTVTGIPDVTDRVVTALQYGRPCGILHTYFAHHREWITCGGKIIEILPEKTDIRMSL